METATTEPGTCYVLNKGEPFLPIINMLIKRHYGASACGDVFCEYLNWLAKERMKDDRGRKHTDLGFGRFIG